MKYYLMIFFFIGAIQCYAQELLFSSGINYTTYEYKNSLGQANQNLTGGNGNYFELSYLHKIDTIGTKAKLKYLVGVVFNEFNANGGNLINVYSWKTGYLGIKGGIGYIIISTKSGFSAGVNLAVNANTILIGEQQINGLFYDLTEQEEFKGYFLQSMAGLDFAYEISHKINIGLGYSYSKNLKISNKTEEILAFKNNLLQFKLQLKLK